MQASVDVPRLDEENPTEKSSPMDTSNTDDNKRDHEIVTSPPTEVVDQHDLLSESSHGMDKDAETQVTDVEEEDEGETLLQNIPSSSMEEEVSSRHKGSPFVYDPNKINIRFLFANHDGLDVTVICNPSDTVGQVKGQLLSLWPNGTHALYLSNKI